MGCGPRWSLQLVSENCFSSISREIDENSIDDRPHSMHVPASDRTSFRSSEPLSQQTKEKLF